MNVSKQIVLRSVDRENLKRAIAEVAEKLYCDNIIALTTDAERNRPVQDMSFSLAMAIFKDKYTVYKSPTSPKSQRQRELRLQKVAKFLGQKNISAISQRDIAAFRKKGGVGSTPRDSAEPQKKVNGRWRDYVLEAKEFLDYILRLKKDSDCGNAFAAYLEKNPTMRDTKKLSSKALGTDCLTQAEEADLNERILNHIENGVMVGIGLVKETALSNKMLCALTWDRVVHSEADPEKLRILLELKEVSGATHDYSFVVSPLGTEILRKRRKYLEEQGFSAEEIKKMNVVTQEGSPKKALAGKELTEKCRNVLQNIGVSYATLAGLKEGNQGAGVTMLRATFRNRLKHTCGLKEDSAMLKFLMHESLTNMVQADHYRCFTDATAQHFQAVVLRRDNRFEGDRIQKRNVRREKSGGGEQIRVSPQSMKHKSVVKLQKRLKPGEQILISAGFGCKVSVRPVEGR